MLKCILLHIRLFGTNFHCDIVVWQRIKNLAAIALVTELFNHIHVRLFTMSDIRLSYNTCWDHRSAFGKTNYREWSGRNFHRAILCTFKHSFTNQSLTHTFYPVYLLTRRFLCILVCACLMYKDTLVLFMCRPPEVMMVEDLFSKLPSVTDH